MKKYLAIVLALAMLLSLGVAAAAASDDFDYSGYEPGVTVIEDASSPTGYTAVFVFDEAGLTDEYIAYIAGQYNVDLSSKLDLSRITRVAVYSNTAMLFSYEDSAADTALNPITGYTPDQYTTGLYPAGGDTNGALFGGAKINYEVQCVEFADGLWGATIPLTSGATDYNIRLGDVFGRSDGTYLYDPANPPMYNTASGVYSRSSMVYVPYCAEKSDVDRTVECPKTEGETGTLEFVAFEENNSIAVYLPAGYDASREEPYNVLYLSHGAQSEFLGSEMRWLNECAGRNIFDNLGIDYIVVSVNNIHNGGENLEKGSSGLWDQALIWEAQERIMAYVEANYNAGTEPANRAYAGFSMGGLTTQNVYMAHADAFDYFGIWSMGIGSLVSEDYLQIMLDNADHAKVQLAWGDWDYCLDYAKTLQAVLDNNGIEYDFFTVPGSHDWRTWQLILADSCVNFFFN